MGCTVRGSNTGTLKKFISTSERLEWFWAHPSSYWKGSEGFQGLNKQNLKLNNYLRPFLSLRMSGRKLLPPVMTCIGQLFPSCAVGHT